MTPIDRSSGYTETRPDAATVVGRRGFVGALAGVVTLAGGAATQLSGAPGTEGLVALPDVLRQRVTRTATAGSRATEYLVATGSTRFRLLVPATTGPHDVLWLHGDHPDGTVAPAPLASRAGRAVDLGVAAAILPAGTDDDQVRAFAWAAEHIGVAASVLAATGSATASAVRAATDRLLPRLLGVHLADPPAALDLGRPVYWSGRRLRIVTTTRTPTGDPVAAVTPFAAETSAAVVADAVMDLATTVRRWRA